MHLFVRFFKDPLSTAQITQNPIRSGTVTMRELKGYG